MVNNGPPMVAKPTITPSANPWNKKRTQLITLNNVAIYKCIKTMSYIDVQIPTILQLNITNLHGLY
jgi:hypothetical protein